VEVEWRQGGDYVENNIFITLLEKEYINTL
jgi:hypothetical protein